MPTFRCSQLIAAIYELLAAKKDLGWAALCQLMDTLPLKGVRFIYSTLNALSSATRENVFKGKKILSFKANDYEDEDELAGAVDDSVACDEKACTITFTAELHTLYILMSSLDGPDIEGRIAWLPFPNSFLVFSLLRGIPDEKRELYFKGGKKAEFKIV